MRTTVLLGGILSLALLSCTDKPGANPVNLAPATLLDSGEGVLPDIPTPPDVDYYDLTHRLRGTPALALPRAAAQTPPPQQVGDVQTFTLTDLQNYNRFTIDAELRVVSAHAYWYVERSIPVDQAGLESSARVFEDKTYLTDTRLFGDTIRGGFDGDPHLTILVSRFSGASGYYSSPDEYPKAIHPHSNQRLMLYINGGVLPPGSNAFNAVIAHELQHAIHWHADPNEESWINEGLSTLAEELNGSRTFSPQSFSRSADVQLTHWEDEASANGPHYAAAHLFLRFLGEHWGGYDRLKELVTEPRDSISGVNAYLRRLGFADDFRDVFKAWVVANYGGKVQDPRYQHGGLQVQVRPDKQLAGPATFTDQVHQYGAKYIESTLAEGGATIDFEGAQVTRILPTEARSGNVFWWSNRGDSIDTKLTREIDLQQVSKATLRFWAWHDIEKGWDYGYVTVSQDGGRSWSVLEGRETSRENPLGNSYGPGFTGKSGGGSTGVWVHEQIDLSAYAGKKGLLRFEYVTDEAVNNAGLAIDDIEIPEIGFKDDAESDAGWDAKGFARTNNRVDQDFIVQVITIASDGTAELQEMRLDTEERGQLQVCCYGDNLRQVVIIVAPLAPFTTEQAVYTLRIQAIPKPSP